MHQQHNAHQQRTSTAHIPEHACSSTHSDSISSRHNRHTCLPVNGAAPCSRWSNSARGSSHASFQWDGCSAEGRISPVGYFLGIVTRFTQRLYPHNAQPAQGGPAIPRELFVSTSNSPLRSRTKNAARGHAAARPPLPTLTDASSRQWLSYTRSALYSTPGPRVLPSGANKQAQGNAPREFLPRFFKVPRRL